MSILIDSKTKAIFQGFTGSQATMHAEQCIAYGTNIVGGVTPGKGGQQHLNLPVFDNVKEAIDETGANTSVIFVPARFSKAAIVEAAENGIKLIICITEGVPVLDMIEVIDVLNNNRGSRLIGPNCPGVITPGEAKLGIMPASIHQKGSVGIVSRSGTLTYEAVNQTSEVGLGQSTCVGIGGDPIIGTTTKDAVALFMNDPETEAIVVIGEIGGQLESDAAHWIKDNGNQKPVIGFIAGETAPKGRTMGHAGAIVGGKDDTAEAKKSIMRSCGIQVVDSPAEIGKKVAEVLA